VAANAGKTALYDAFAHDLRNPLNTIGMTLALLQRKPSADGAARALRALDRLKRMNDQLVAFSRLHDGGLALKPRAGTLDELVARAVAQAGSPSVRVEGGSIAGTWDGDLLALALAELLRNGVEHGGGEVVLRAFATGERVRIEVETAKPIDAAAQPYVFDPVERLRALGKVRADGLGLGLHLARAFVEAHGGTLTLAAADGPTRFLLEAPIHTPEGTR
jgi:signal transduction histidine kinase